MNACDLAVYFPTRWGIRLSSGWLSGDIDGPNLRRMLDRVPQAKAISQVAII
jgi:hypothetical protein